LDDSTIRTAEREGALPLPRRFAVVALRRVTISGVSGRVEVG
jgi:hypothetical protein